MVEPPSDGEVIAEIAGRICYMSFGKGRKNNAEYLGNIIGQQHFSVLEHANFTFIITGVSRALTHELVRHRHFSFSQLSQRYVDHSEADIITSNRLTPELKESILRHHAEALDLYRRVHAEIDHPADTYEKKQVRGIARGVLPEATSTKIVVTGNVRTWREFIQKRNSYAADQEIRELARMVLNTLMKEAPVMFNDLARAS